MAACIGSYVRLYGYRNGVGGGTLVRCVASNGVSSSGIRRNSDGVCCSARVPSARGAAAYRQSSRAALADGLVGSYGSLNVGLYINSYYIGFGAVSVLLHNYAVGGGGRG